MNSIGRIGFVGGGRIAQAMAKGFISAGLTKPSDLTASVHVSDKLSLESFKNLGVETITENEPVVQKSDIVFISVKPPVVPTILSEVKSKSNGKLFISVAMGVTLNTLEKNLSPGARVIRVMPNIPVLVQAGCSVYVRGSKATHSDASIAQNLMESVGTCEEVTEDLMNVVTALSGSGPAYAFVMIEALADGAVRMGMPRDLAYRLAAQTLRGSGQMVRETGVHPAQLKDNVTSPAGSTAAGLKHLEDSGFRGAVAGAVESATLLCRKTSEK